MKRWGLGIVGAVILITGLGRIVPADLNPWLFVVVGAVLVYLGWGPR